MVRPFAFISAILLLLTTEHTKASSCVEIADSKSRLTCFDNAVLCRTVPNDTERLACFDRVFDRALPGSPTVRDPVSTPVVSAPRAPAKTISSPSVTNVAAPKAGPSQPARTEPVSSEKTRQQLEESEFGLPDRRQAKNANFIEATIVRIQTNANRIDYLKLDNGQVWREVEDGRLRFKEGQRVRIESGLLSSYKLKIVGKNLSVKVKRTK